MRAVVIGCLGVSLLAGCGGGGGGGGDNPPPARDRTLTINGVYTNLCGLDVADSSNLEIVLHDDQGNYLESVYLVEGTAEIQTGSTANISVVDSYGGNLFINSYLQLPVAADGSTLRVHKGKLVGGDRATEGCDCTTVDVAANASTTTADHSNFAYDLPDGAEQMASVDSYDLLQRQQICAVSGQPATGATVLAAATAGGHIELASLEHATLDGVSDIEIDLDQSTAELSYAADVGQTEVYLSGGDGSGASWSSANGTIELPQSTLPGIRMTMVQLSPGQSDYANDVELTLFTAVNNVGYDLDVLEERPLPALTMTIGTSGDELLINVPSSFGTDLQRSSLFFPSDNGGYYYQVVYSPALVTLPALELSPQLEEQAEALLAASDGSIYMWLGYLNMDDVTGYPAALGLINSPEGNGESYRFGYQSQQLTLTYSGGFSTQPRVSTLVSADRQRPRLDLIKPNQPLLRRINGQQVLIQR